MAKALVYQDYRCALLGALVTVARGRTTAPYSQVVALGRLPLDLQHNPVHRNILSAWLLEIAKEDQAAGRPLLPAVVVRASSGLPGPGYFAMLQALGRDHTGESESDVHGSELQAVFDYYGDRLALVDCWVVPASHRDHRIIEIDRPPRFILQPIRYPHSTPRFLVIHSGAYPDGRHSEYVTPEWFGAWEVLPSIWAYRFILRGDPMSWMLASWEPDESGRRVRITLKGEDMRCIDVRKTKEYEDGAFAFEALWSDSVKTWGKARWENECLHYFDKFADRSGWPEVPPEMVKAAYRSTIPGSEP
jgi:hypothetical protein